MKDRLGNDINVGDRVVWGAGGRRMFGLRVGEVLELKTTAGYKTGTPLPVGHKPPATGVDYVVCKSTENGYRGGAFKPNQVVVIRT